MDVATLIGVIAGAAVVVVAIVVGGDAEVYLNPQALMIVLGGATAATITAFPLARFMKLPRIVGKALYARSRDPVELIRQLVELAEVARRDGILALEAMASRFDDPFLISGIQMAVDGTDPEVIRSIMETELENLVERHDAGKGLLDAMGRYAPAFGMIGTLVGLVAMLRDLKDPTKIGSGMAAALLTTLYGALLANVLLLPLADKLGHRSDEEVLMRTIIIQGVMAIQAGDNPRNVYTKLMTYLPPEQRVYDDERMAA